MSADHYASDDGKFFVMVRNAETGIELGRVQVSGLLPRQPITMEVLQGWNWQDVPKEPPKVSF